MNNNFQLTKIKSSLIVLFFGFLISCNPGNNYQTLSLFFDGVPKPTVKSKISDTTDVKSESSEIHYLQKRKPTEKYIHRGYKKNECGSCHDVDHAYRLIERQPQLCYRCHKNYKDQYKYLHGPVAAGYCTVCHHPHQSQNAHLLNIEIEQLCGHCHEPGDVSKNPSHKDLGSVNCVQCHNSHGGETLNMLKPGIKSKS